MKVLGIYAHPVPFVLFCRFPFCPGWIELAGSDDSWEPSSTGRFVGVGVITTGCSGSLGVASKSLRLVNRSRYELMFSSTIFFHFRQQAEKVVKFWRRVFIVVVGDY